MHDPLASLLHPMTVGTFVDRHFERTHAHVRRGTPFAPELVSPQAIDDALARMRLEFPQVRMAHGGVLDPSAFTLDGGVIDPARVAERLAAGATLVLDGAHHWHAPLGALCRDLGDAFSGSAWANVYLTPNGAQGFPAHADTHDVFVLQILGRKTWSLHAPPSEVPPLGERYEGREDFGPVIDTFALAPGDLLYIPRGQPHAARAEAEATLHVTVGFAPPSWVDVIAAAAGERARVDPRLRRSVPPGPRGARGEAAKQFRRLLKSLGENAALDDALGAFAAEHIQRSRPYVPGALVAALTAQPLGAKTTLRPHPHLRWVLLARADGVELTVPGRTLHLPAVAEAPLRFVLAGRSFRVKDIPELDARGRLTLARRLVREGVLEVVPRDG